MATSHPFRIDRLGRTAQPESVDAELRELIELVLFTSPGERVMRPTFGSGLSQLVFAPKSEAMATATQQLVRGSLQLWLADRIEVQEVDVETTDSDLIVRVTWRRRASDESETTTFSTAGPA